jgi:hypothetical protein
MSWTARRERMRRSARCWVGNGAAARRWHGAGTALDYMRLLSRQVAGVTGKVENCVSWVLAALVTASGQVWADFDIYMPDC